MGSVFPYGITGNVLCGLAYLETCFFFFRCPAEQAGECGESCILWIDWKSTMWFNLVENLFLLFSTGVELNKLDNVWRVLSIHTYIHHSIHHFSGAPHGAFQQPVFNKCKVPWLRVLARPLQAVHNVFFV